MNHRKASLTHLMRHALSMIWIFHTRMVEKLEELEPGVHRFLPIEVRDLTNKVAYPDDYKLILLTQAVECFDEEKTRWSTPLGEKYGKKIAVAANYTPSPSNDSPIHMKHETTIGLHFWRGAPSSGRASVFCSDELAAWVKAQGLRGWKLQACR